MAFQLSGRELDTMKKENLLISVKFENGTLNDEWAVHTKVMTDLFENWSTPQIEAILLSLLGETQSEVAVKLGVSQAAVHQRLKSAKYYLVQLIMNRYKQIF
jgi:DNA-directed RNA polymerase specialized sigma24 family protein